MKETGKKLIGILDGTAYSPEAAFWFYAPALDKWKLAIVIKKIANRGPREMYRVLQKVLDKSREDLSALPLEELSLLPLKAPIVQLLERALRTERDAIQGIRFTGNVVDGNYIDDTYIYRMATKSGK